jgi:hypothetical protein
MAGGRTQQQQMESTNYVSGSQPRTRFCTHALPTATEILGWLETNAESLFIQTITSGRRAKNRAVVQFRDSAGEVKAVGGVSIAAAVARAKARKAALAAKGI